MATSLAATNESIVREFLEVLSAGDVAAVVERFHDDGSWRVSGPLAMLSGNYSRQELGPLLRGLTTLYEHGTLRITPLAMIAQGDSVAVEAESHAKLRNGKVHSNPYHFVFELDQGRIKRVIEYMDAQPLA
ncbi:hypothetical protein PTE30175_05580 [Pandoraea terrae]|uniref:SnoaL-like domain-containing protein n=1 Tax=Pandoraea terrae TaxID=1537710 RepID=A0A5E4ZFN9_9BURK|nr:nuclear transport factor 2 family protein [Pandoraea terrae]VVE59668.1 hypothetical protein PTE30175_05580 [Pandoraea terrae]